MGAKSKTRAELIAELRASRRRWAAFEKNFRSLMWHRAELKAIYEYAPVLLCTLDKHGRILDANRAFCQFSGVPEKQLLAGRACGVFGCINALDNPRGCGFGIKCRECKLRLAIEDSLKTGRAHRNMECRAMLKHKGIQQQIVLLGSTVRISAGNQPRLLLCLQDVTENRQAELALHDSETRLRALFEYSMAGMLLAAPDGRIFAANPAACRMLERTEKDICKAGRLGVIDPDDARIFVLLKERVEKGYASGELNLIRADGTRLAVYASSAVFETAEGLRTCLVFQDISERKLAEERIRVFSQKLLSAREDEKRQLAAALHHEVGSAAVSVLSRLNAAEDDLRRGKHKEALTSLKECSNLFAQATKRLRMIAVELRPPDLDLLCLRDALRQHLLRISRETSVRFRMTDNTRAASIAPDVQTFLFRAAQECLNNVITHSKASRAWLNLSIARGQIRLSVRDDGKGFNVDYWASKPGKHLGLQAVREMATALGGTLDIVSKRGCGTNVIVKVPEKGKQ